MTERGKEDAKNQGEGRSKARELAARNRENKSGGAEQARQTSAVCIPKSVNHAGQVAPPVCGLSTLQHFRLPIKCVASVVVIEDGQWSTRITNVDMAR